MNFMRNKYARCECELGSDPDFPICTFFEDAMEGDEIDICKACRHGEECHLKGHEPLDLELEDGNA